MATTQPLRLWHLTSLDAPTVAVTWLLAFAWAANLNLPLWLPITLALITWSIYIADRLLDTWNAAHRADRPDNSLVPDSDAQSLRPRHRFHWNHRRLFLPAAVASVFAALVLVHHNMPHAARERNSFLAAAALAYFTGVHNPWRSTLTKFKIPKELLVGILFTLACALPTLTRIAPNSPTRPVSFAAPILAFIALAWLNCHAIETWESNSLISILKPALILTTATLVLAGASYHHPRIALLLASAAASAALLALLDQLQQKLHPTTLRALADLVLLTPLTLLILLR